MIAHGLTGAPITDARVWLTHTGWRKVESDVSLQEQYRRVRTAAQLDEVRANEIVHQARSRAQELLVPGLGPDAPLQVSARLVSPAAARGGSLIPAWPLQATDGSVTIEFVADWGAMLAGWCAAVGDDADTIDLDDLVQSRERPWVGIANDVLQKFVPDPPEGTYSMVRHHALMLVAATIWLGRERARHWQAAHDAAARAFLAQVGGGSLWGAVESAERGLGSLLADARAKAPAEQAIAWLDADAAARASYLEYLGAASLGIAALIATAPNTDDLVPWLRTLIYEQHPSPDFNRGNVEAFAQRLRTS